MAIPFLTGRRKLIPNWRSFKTTLKLGELASANEVYAQSDNNDLIKDKITAWKNSPTILSAAELLNASTVLGFSNMDEINSAAEFISENPQHSSVSLLSLANKFCEKISEDNIPSLITLDLYEEFEELRRKEKLRKKINTIKKRIYNHPRNAILWVELSRYYSIIGQLEQAIKTMKIAYSLAPENRFILRSLSRLFVHSGDYDIAHDIIRKSPLIKSDPWILSAEIALASQRERQSKFIKEGINMVNSDKFNPFSITELSSGIGTIELENGTVKKSKSFFTKSMISPNDNSLAQAEWAIQEEKKLHLIIPRIERLESFEAMAYECYEKNDWNGVLDNCLKWFVDTPHSKTSMLIGHHVACIFLKDNELSIKFCEAALVSHPNDPTLLNNLSYSLALLNRTEEASKYIKIAENDPDLSETDSICVKATKGLIHFRVKEIEKGRELYLEAMNEAKKTSHDYFFTIALLNLTREEILIKSKDIERVVEQMKKITANSEHKDIIFMREEIIRLYNKKK